MKRCLLLSLLVYQLAYTQEPSINWGPIMARGTVGLHNWIVPIDSSYFLISPNMERKKTIRKFNSNHQLIFEKPYQLEYEGEKLKIDQIITTKNKVYASCNYWIRKEQIGKVLFCEIDTEGIFGNPKVVVEGPYINGRFITLFNYNIDVAEFDKSPNNELLMNIRPFSYRETGHKETFIPTVFDESLNIKWTKKIELDYPDEKIRLGSFVLLNNGTVVGSALIDETDTQTAQRKIMIINSDNYLELPFQIQNIYEIKKMYLLATDSNTVIIFGLFCDYGGGPDIKGAFTAMLDCKENKISEPQIFAFDSAVIATFPIKKSTRSGDSEPINVTYPIIDFSLTSDGGFFIAFEKSYEFIRRTYVPATTTRDGFVPASTYSLTAYMSDERYISYFDNKLNKKKDIVISNFGLPAFSRGKSTYTAVLGDKVCISHISMNKYHWENDAKAALKFSIVSPDGETKTYEFPKEDKKFVVALDRTTIFGKSSLLLLRGEGYQHQYGILNIE